MSALETIKELLPGQDEETERRTYECRSCGTEFKSAAAPEKASCRECFSKDVEAV